MKLVCLIAAALMAGLPADSAMSDENARVVTVSGRGKVSVEPDEARVSLTVLARADQQQAAQRDVDDKVEAVLRMLGQLDIPRKEISTTRVNISPEYRWDKGTSQRQIVGYMVQRTIEIELSELEKLGELMQRATAAGVNQVSPPVLGAKEEDEHRRAALAKAAEDARLNARTLARTLNAKLGPVRRITGSDVAQPVPIRPMMESRAMMSDSAAKGAETYTPGQIEFSASVTVEFDLETN